MVGNVPISLMCSSVPEVQAGPAFGSVTVPTPTVAVALVTVASYFCVSARATATATLNSRSVRDPWSGVELELLGSLSTRLPLLAHPATTSAARKQATAANRDGTTLRRGDTTEWFHEQHERTSSRPSKPGPAAIGTSKSDTSRLTGGRSGARPAPSS